MRESLVTSGFPRSGNTYLNYALYLLFYPNEEINNFSHLVSSIKPNKKTIVPFRNPLDSIASWQTTFSNGSLEGDIKYYIRFYSYVLNNLDTVVLMDFDKFTQDIDYIKSQISANYNLTTDISVTDDEVKMAMLVNNKEINLPRNEKEELNLVKSTLESMPEFQECLDLYNRLKQI